MSEEHNETTQTNSEEKRNRIAESSINGSVVTFVFSNGQIISCDVSKLPPDVQHLYAVEGVRTAGRLAFQKMEDPEKAAAAVQSRFERMQSGDVTPARRYESNVDDLTQAIANVLKQNVSFVEDVWFPRYFESKESGCRRNVSKDGRVRIYGKKEALDKLRLDPEIKPELDRLAKERAGKARKNNAKIDIAGIAA